MQISNACLYFAVVSIPSLAVQFDKLVGGVKSRQEPTCQGEGEPCFEDGGFSLDGPGFSRCCGPLTCIGSTITTSGLCEKKGNVLFACLWKQEGTEFAVSTLNCQEPSCPRVGDLVKADDDWLPPFTQDDQLEWERAGYMDCEKFTLKCSFTQEGVEVFNVDHPECQIDDDDDAPQTEEADLGMIGAVGMLETSMQPVESVLDAQVEIMAMAMELTEAQDEVGNGRAAMLRIDDETSTMFTSTVDEDDRITMDRRIAEEPYLEENKSASAKAAEVSNLQLTRAGRARPGEAAGDEQRAMTVQLPKPKHCAVAGQEVTYKHLRKNSFGPGGWYAVRYNAAEEGFMTCVYPQQGYASWATRPIRAQLVMCNNIPYNCMTKEQAENACKDWSRNPAVPGSGSRELCYKHELGQTVGQSCRYAWTKDSKGKEGCYESTGNWMDPELGRTPEEKKQLEAMDKLLEGLPGKLDTGCRAEAGIVRCRKYEDVPDSGTDFPLKVEHQYGFDAACCESHLIDPYFLYKRPKFE